MSNSPLLLIKRWCAQSKRKRTLIYIALFVCIFIGEVGIVVFRPFLFEIQQNTRYQEKVAELISLKKSQQQAKCAQLLMVKYASLLPEALIEPSSISLYQSLLMSILQQLTNESRIQDPNIQLRDCHSSKEKKDEIYCDLFIMFDAPKEQVVQFIQKVLNYPWFVIIKDSHLKLTKKQLLHTQLHLSFLFPASVSVSQKSPIRLYQTGLNIPPIKLDTSQLRLHFFPHSRHVDIPLNVVKGKPNDNRDESQFEHWKYNGVIRRADQLIAHLSHGDYPDVWLHKGKKLMDSQWRLQEISMDAIVFIHDVSNQIVRVSYSGEIL